MIDLRTVGFACVIGVMFAGARGFVGIRTTWAADRMLPEGRVGIASKHPGDRGIENDSSLVFVEKFDAGSVAAIAKRWEVAQNESIMSLSSDVAAGSADAKSLVITHVGGKGSGGHLYRRLMPGCEKLHYRFYVDVNRVRCWRMQAIQQLRSELDA